MVTKLPATERFFQPGISKVYWIPTIADAETLIPTRAEIDAGTDLSDEIANISGFTVTTAMISTPDYGKRFSGQISGRTSVAESSLSFHADRQGDDVRTVLARGDRGFLLFADHGDALDMPADVYPAEVSSLGKVRSVTDTDLQLTVMFAITKQPAEDISLPAPTP